MYKKKPIRVSSLQTNANSLDQRLQFGTMFAARLYPHRTPTSRWHFEIELRSGTKGRRISATASRVTRKERGKVGGSKDNMTEKKGVRVSWYRQRHRQL